VTGTNDSYHTLLMALLLPDPDPDPDLDPRLSILFYQRQSMNR
jgi:hypothetical protein